MPGGEGILSPLPQAHLSRPFGGHAAAEMARQVSGDRIQMRELAAGLTGSHFTGEGVPLGRATADRKIHLAGVGGRRRFPALRNPGSILRLGQELSLQPGPGRTGGGAVNNLAH